MESHRPMSQPPPAPPADATGGAPVITPGRRNVVVGLLLVLLVGHAVAVADHAEVWPFSPYGLYARIYETGPHTELMLYGVRPDGSQVRLTHDYFPPLDEGRLRRILGKDFEYVLARGRLEHEPLAKWLDLYDARRGGEDPTFDHGGPALAGIRLYMEQRFFDARAANRRGPPDELWFHVQHFRDGAAPTPLPAGTMIHGTPQPEVTIAGEDPR